MEANSRSLNVSPYIPPPDHPISPVGKPVSLSLLISLTLFVGFLAALGVASRPPTLLSPTPFLSILLLRVLGGSALTLGALSVALFVAVHFRHFVRRPNASLGIFGTLTLLAMTLLSIPYFMIDAPLGFIERGATYTCLVIAFNVVTCAFAWCCWFRARKPGSHLFQVFFGFTLQSWFFWCFLPYLGAA